MWIMESYAEPVVVNHGELWWASVCESWCKMMSQWLCIVVCYAESIPQAQHNTPWFTTTGPSKHTIIHNLRLNITHHDSQPLDQHSTPWFIATGSVNHCVLCCGNGCESWFIMLSQWLWIVVYHVEPVIVNHSELFWASSYESWCAMLIQNTPWFTTTGSK
jgi:hypothetical protein